MLITGFSFTSIRFDYLYRADLLNGLTILKNRGFDSAGLATMKASGGKMVSAKLLGGLPVNTGLSITGIFSSLHYLYHYC